MNTQNQQGDVLLLRVSELPANSKLAKRDERGAILAEGETTGHYHACKDSGVELLEAPNGYRFLHNTTEHPVTIEHQEHKPVTVAPGIWRIGQVREKDWFQDMVRTVID
jgi:hypothetical protein